MSGRLTLALAEQVRSMTRWILTDSHLVVSRKKESLDRNQYCLEETRENNAADIKFGETDVIPRGALIVEAPEFQSNIIAPTVNGSLTSLTSEALEISSVPSVLSERDASPFVHEVCEAHSNAHELSHSFAYKLSVPATQTNLGGYTSSADHMQEETDEFRGLKLRLIEESGTKNLDRIFRLSTRQELHTVTEVENLDTLEQFSSCATLQKISNYSSLANRAEGSNLTTQKVILPIGDIYIKQCYLLIAGLSRYYIFILMLT